MSSYLDRVEAILKDVIAVAARDGKRTGFCIGNTSKVDAGGLYFTPVRNTRQVVAGSVIVYQAHQAAEIGGVLDGRVDYVFVDTEKKIGPDPDVFGPGDLGNIERAVRDVVKRSRVLTFKGNDLTVEAIDCLLAQIVRDRTRGIGGKKVAIIGAGNVGSKLALKLVERGANVVIARRDAGKLTTIVSAVNVIKPARTFASVTGTTDNEEAARDADILIGFTNGVPVITRRMIERAAPGALIMDGGKGCLFPDAAARADELGLMVLRVDVRAAFEGQVAMLLEMERILDEKMGRGQLAGVRIVSGGLLGRAGEIVVDSVRRPTTVYGVADGRGDFVRSPTPEQQAALERLRAVLPVAAPVDNEVAQ